MDLKIEHAQTIIGLFLRPLSITLTIRVPFNCSNTLDGPRSPDVAKNDNKTSSFQLFIDLHFVSMDFSKFLPVRFWTQEGMIQKN